MIIPRLFILLACFLSVSNGTWAQNVGAYAANWKKVDDLIQKKNLPRSALTIVNAIYAQARKENNDAQLIKALVYRSTLQAQNREDNQLLAIRELEAEPAMGKEPAASLLNSLLANLYWQYYQQHRWQLYNRTATANFDKSDIATWTTEDFHRRITGLYLRSIQNESLLQSIKVSDFEPLVIRGNARQLRPTLYDLLAHHALDYFKTGEYDLKKPAFAFTLNDSIAYAPAAEFVAHSFTTRDSLSLQHKALLTYQELTSFHLRDKDPQPLIDLELDRLQFVHGISTSADKQDKYVHALRRLTDAHKTQPSVARAWYLLAAYHENRAAQYHPARDTATRWERNKAREILERVVRDSSTKGEGWVESFNLLQQITRPTLSFDLEKVNLPAKPFRALVKYKDIPRVSFTLIAATEEIRNGFRGENGRDYWGLLEKAASVRTWTQDLPQTGDLQEHAAEIKVDGLPAGTYILLAKATGTRTAPPMGAQLFHVSAISYVHSQNAFFVLHRETGMPLAQAEVEVFTQQYNYTTGKYSRNKTGSYGTDKNGYFLLNQPLERGQNGYGLRITHKGDRLWDDALVYSYRNYGDGQEPVKKTQERLFLFTDRSIYRPGQTMYFKGIALRTDGRQGTIRTGVRTRLYLRDANQQVVDSLVLTSNDFGSFNGTFALPQQLLNGTFSLADSANVGHASFQVEEYKRPRFYVAFEKVKGTYKVGDTIRLEGKATAYAGNNVDGANVVYRVVRQPRFIYPWLRSRGWWPQSAPQEIAHGEVATNADGRFIVAFQALEDKTLDPKWEPVFDYRVFADVTDRAGETRSSEYGVSAGFKSLLLQLEIPEKLPLDSLNAFSIRTSNMNGAHQRATVKVQVTRILPGQRLIRQRLWEAPDQFTMDRATFVALFPNDEYGDESDPKTWTRGSILLEQSDTTRGDGTFQVDKKDLEPGFYEVSASTRDEDGLEVKDIRYIELYNQRGGPLARPQYLWSRGSRPVEPGKQTSIELGTSAPRTFVIQHVEKAGTAGASANAFQFHTLDGGRKPFEFSATEEDRGGYGVHFFFVRDNRLYNFTDMISVPWSNKELDITFGTFRDKTTPGSEEKWTVTTKGKKGEKWAAEMMVSMYDASLDAFHPHAWSAPGIWSTFTPRFRWQGAHSFAAVQSDAKWQGEAFRQYVKTYDRLLFAGFGYTPLYKRAGYGQDLSEVRVTAATQVRVRGIASAAPEAAQDAAAREEKVANADIGEAVPPPAVAQQTEGIAIRKNFNETAFFFPDLRTDRDGNISFSFSAPEALTRWKLQTIAHTTDLAFGRNEATIVTQKELMVQPAAPRFLRQGDRIEFSARIVNLSGKELTGQAEFQLRDAATNQPVDGWFLNSFPNQYFTVAAGASEVVKFPMEVPYQFASALVWTIVARAGSFSDGEEMALPVLSNKMLVTESMPLPMRTAGTKTFRFEKLINAGSPTLVHHGLTVEYTSNPAWYAVQALPFLMEGSTDNAEGAWNRYYANALASRIVASSPKIRAIFDSWKTLDTTAIRSNLQKNEALRSALLEETPWVLQAKTEAQQKQNIALLFDLVRMSRELNASLQKVRAAQMSSGGFAWIPGAPEDRYMTGYILTGAARLRKLGAVPAQHINDLRAIEDNGVQYLARKIDEDYARLVKSGAKLNQNNLGTLQIQYVYVTSMQDRKRAESKGSAYYTAQAAQFWMSQNKYMQGMIALALHYRGDKKTPAAILKSLKETAVQHEELGMYWKEGTGVSRSFWWHAPIETQALLIEAFSEIGRDEKTVDELTTWLLKNKQSVSWRTTKATADACYALLLRGTDLLSSTPGVQVQLGSTAVGGNQAGAEAGTGYFTKRIEPPFVKPAMGNISVTVEAPPKGVTAVSWGAVYWQYFEDLDKITPAATLLQLQKKLFVETATDRGLQLTPVTPASSLKPGTKIKVRIELKVDRDMEYVHMRDQRSSALEPVNVLSQYKWQGGLGYYETTKDASTSFFFPFLRRGTYVFEYPLFVTHTGSFSNGITTIQSMYAPEFSAHSEGVRLTVE